MKPPRLKLAWEHRSLEELAEQQGVQPARNLEELAALWPVDDDPDELLRFILDERKARRDHHTRQGPTSSDGSQAEGRLSVGNSGA
jgi:hypothetical protein